MATADKNAADSLVTDKLQAAVDLLYSAYQTSPPQAHSALQQDAQLQQQYGIQQEYNKKRLAKALTDSMYAGQLQATTEDVIAAETALILPMETKIGKTNADMMTMKRVGTIYGEQLIHTRTICEYLRIAAVFLSFVVLFLFCAGMHVIPFGIAQGASGVLIVAMAVVMIAKKIRNFNHYHMLYQDRDFDTSDLKADLTCDGIVAQLKKDMTTADGSSGDDTPAAAAAATNDRIWDSAGGSCAPAEPPATCVVAQAPASA